MEQKSFFTNENQSQAAVSTLTIAKPSSMSLTPFSASSTALNLRIPALEEKASTQKEPKWIQKSNGVPGFPDFPDVWVGQEGRAVSTRDKSNKTEHRPRPRPRPKSKPVRREAVNKAGIKKQTGGKKKNTKPKKLLPAKKWEEVKRKRKIRRKMNAKHKRAMNALNKSLEALSCA